MGYLSRRAFCNGVTPKTAARYKNTPFTLDYLCAGKGSFLLPDHDAWKLWGRLPDLLTTRKRPVFSQPFFTDRKRTKRLLQSLDRDARRIAPYLIARMPLAARGLSSMSVADLEPLLLLAVADSLNFGRPSWNIPGSFLLPTTRSRTQRWQNGGRSLASIL